MPVNPDQNRLMRTEAEGRELEIALRRQIRMLDDIGRTVTFDQRDPVDKAKEEASDIRDDLLKALFGEQNAPAHKS
jgi:hypothetical protein